MKPWRDYVLGDMIARYIKDDQSSTVGLILLPNTMASEVRHKYEMVDSLVQIKLLGDAYPSGFAHGHSMRNSGTLDKLEFQDQHVIEGKDRKTIISTWNSPDSYKVEHHFIWYTDYNAIESYVVIRNKGERPITVEMLSSFSLTGITPFAEDDASDTVVLHRVLSSWSAEGRLMSNTLAELNLEPAWAPFGNRCLRFGQVGSMPVREFFPTAFLEDTRAGVTWGVQIAHPASWQIELGRRDHALYLSGGLADREFGHWYKTIGIEESFQSPSAFLTTVAGDVDCAAERLTAIQNRPLAQLPAVENDLPIIFNDYCTTWGSPSASNLYAIAEQLKGKGIQYLVIDCGWYKSDTSNWFNSMGDWEVSRSDFPNGLEETVEHIRKCGLIPGIWFEMEVCGEASTAFHNTEHLLKRDGFPITVGRRRFWDFRDPYVIEYLREKVIQFMKQHRFGYLKVDYNDSLGIGCDGSESLGEGLRSQMQAVQDFFRLIKKEIPDIVIENCASGGHRLEPSMLAITSMSSFSDAHECEEIPIIAANLHRVILPRQSQIWAVLRKQDSLQRLVYSLSSTMLGRMCLSGDIHELSHEQWKVVEQAIKFYKDVAPIIKEGTTRRYGSTITRYRKPEGWQAIMRTSNDHHQLLVVIHTFDGALAPTITLPLQNDLHYEITSTFSEQHVEAHINDESLTIRLHEPFSAACLQLSALKLEI
ncbi:glycoside hydrolase family 36 protein [Paenibacillus septentrionalis]|uniref:Alpha-galactosidase n=1 Tax=Paenibacillus septentrionalis TaxID=429342 RepID=A0ABW1V6I3_9BACL